VGDMATASASTHDNDDANRYWFWMGQLHHLATTTGIGVTDLGVSLYPTLDLETVQTEVLRQTSAVAATVNHILTRPSTDAALAAENIAPTLNAESSSTLSPPSTAATLSTETAAEVTAATTGPTIWALPLEVTDVASNVQRAIATRKQQALSAVAAAQAAATSVQQPTDADADAAI
jgi:hypothetical protein